MKQITFYPLYFEPIFKDSSAKAAFDKNTINSLKHIIYKTDNGMTKHQNKS